MNRVPGTPISYTQHGDPLFSGDDRCPSCGLLILAGHASYVFAQSPADIEAQWQQSNKKVGDDAEWKQEPGRVAFYRPPHGPMIQVHEGPDSGEWVPCSFFTVTRNGLPYSMWMCRSLDDFDPMTTKDMEDISS